MKGFALGLLALVLRGLGILIMIVAYVVVSIAGWLEMGTEWADRKRGFQIVQVGTDESLDEPDIDFHNKQTCICWRCVHDRGED